MKSNIERNSALGVFGTNPLVIKFGHEPRWVNWRFVKIDGRKTKIPYTVSGKKASSTNPNDWSTFSDAAANSSMLGIVFSDSKTLCGIDIDDCLKNGKIVHEKKKAIQELIAKSDSYVEISPSGEGLHIYLEILEPLELVANRHGSFEAYTSGRYFTTTFKPFGNEKPIRKVTPEEALSLLEIVGYPWRSQNIPNLPQNEPRKTVFHEDSDLLEHMFSSKNGAKIRAVYNGDLDEYGGDESSADMALLAYLTYWTGKNASQIERIWLGSPLGSRAKTQKRKDYRDTSILKAIGSCKEIYKHKDKREKEDKKPAAEFLLDKIENSEGTILFRDQVGDAYIAFEAAGHREIRRCASKAVRQWLANEYWKAERKALPSEAIKTIVNTLEGRASGEGLQNDLEIRFAWHGDELWYDLTDESWQAVKITSKKWEIVNEPPILFKRYPHNRPQVIPIAGGNPRLLLNYVNLKDDQQKLLLLVFLISCFIPGFPHVLLVIFGSQGSAKSTLSRLLRRVIDPSVIEVASMPDTHKELVQTLAHHAFLFFDNVSYISEVTSDILCKAVTGSGFPKRELYSDDEDVIYTFKRCLGINGINLVSTRPDLLERSLLLGLDRIDPRNRKQDKELNESLERDLPLILGGILDVLVKALQIHPKIKIENTPRMADFASWGCAISEALGDTAENFLKAYEANIANQTEVSINENIVASVLVSFMADKEEWRGSASKLLQELTHHGAPDQFDIREKYWPKSSAILMRRLNELAVNLKAVGITFVSISSGTLREVTLKRDLSDETDDKS